MYTIVSGAEQRRADLLVAAQAPPPWPGDIQVSVVVPVMNEAASLGPVLRSIPPWVDEVVLVDGNSTDETVALARHIMPGIRVVAQHGRGKGQALRQGFEAARGDIVVMIDGDGSTDPAEIPAFVGALLAGADFAKGSRYLQGGGSTDISRFRALGNWGLLRVVHLLFPGQHYSDLCYGYNAFWRTKVAKLRLDCDGFEIETSMNLRAFRAGLQVTEVPSFEKPRIAGESRLHPIRDGWRVLKTIWRERFEPLPPALIPAGPEVLLGTRPEGTIVAPEADGSVLPGAVGSVPAQLAVAANDRLGGGN